ncbi:GNAT family N-acetyltransferase [Uliginosibacterium sp. 31-12]|uniref:GNAT family N-acetyltransferase n=1 Tax=Uliginosibacterium sp. 31-12 TaxID=3062781 RepID=UPI0026E13E36|nr:GNAT family protein [Uliginosibacterium sp. 31-12]MDO6385338.1 GNAT family protein [Uliginosibacterium sp. 31-12]
MNWPPAELRTPRLLLRKPLPSDAEAVFARLSGETQVTRYLGWAPHAELRQTRQLISLDLLRWDRGAGWTWLIEEDGSVIGLLQLTRIEPHLLRLGCMLTPTHWGRGLMSDALRALLATAFTQPSLQRIEALCDVDNLASARMLEKASLRQEGRLACHTLHPNISSRPRDMLLYAITRSDNGDPPLFTSEDESFQTRRALGRPQPRAHS